MTLKRDFLKHQANLELTLISSDGESYSLGYASDITPLNGKIKMRWSITDEPDAIYPFTHAILHDKNKILTAMEITPVDPMDMSKVFELVYSY